ncbi:MAG: hypothetical protein PVF45_06740 [Anaerolineae bacterium]|jgi:hypothetical protein
MSQRERWAVLAGVALALVGAWGSWVPHRVAALSLSAWDLAEFVKFVPGALVPREMFFLPPWCAGITLVVVGNLPICPFAHLKWRVGLGVVALGLMVAILPPYPDLFRGYRLEEWRWQFFLGMSGILVTLLGVVASEVGVLRGRWSARVAGGLLLALALGGAVPALWQFIQVRNEIEAVYGASLGWGWGVVVFLIGWGLVGAIGGRALVNRDANDP